MLRLSTNSKLFFFWIAEKKNEYLFSWTKKHKIGGNWSWFTEHFFFWPKWVNNQLKFIVFLVSGFFFLSTISVNFFFEKSQSAISGLLTMQSNWFYRKNLLQVFLQQLIRVNSFRATNIVATSSNEKPRGFCFEQFFKKN